MGPQVWLVWSLIAAGPAGPVEPTESNDAPSLETPAEARAEESGAPTEPGRLDGRPALTATVATSTAAASSKRTPKLQGHEGSAEVRRDLQEAERSRREAAEAARAAEARAAAAEAARAEAERSALEARRRARQARTELLRRLQAERARLAAAAAELAEARRRLAEARATSAKDRQAASSQARRLVEGSRGVASSSAAAALFPVVDGAWRRATIQLDDALAAPAPDLPALPSLADLRELTVGTSTEAAALQAAVEAQRAEAAALRSAALSEEVDAQRQAVNGWRSLLLGLTGARSRLWPLAQALEGRSWKQTWAVARAELQALRVSNLAWARSRIREWQAALRVASPRALLALLQPGLLALFVALGFVVLHALILQLRRRIRGAQDGLRSLIWLRRLEAVDRWLGQLGPPLLLFGAAETIRIQLGGPENPEIVFGALIARWIGIYWAVRNVLTQLVGALVRRGRRVIPRMVRQEIASSVTASARALVIGGLALELARFELGAGVLAQSARVGVAVLLLGLILLLLRRWRGAVADAYLRSFPEGRLARTVEASRDRSYGFFVVAVAFVAVSLRTLGQLAQEALLSVEQIRRALAFVFKVRLERMRDGSGPTVDISELPPSIRKICRNRPLESDRVRVDRFPYEALSLERLERWRGQGLGGSLLLEGEKGCGKTTWLLRLHEQLGEPARWLRPDGDDPDGLVAFLRRGGSPPELQPSVIFIDDLNRWLSRAPGGLAPYDRLTEWLGGAGHAHLVVATCHGLFWRYLCAARPQRLPFDHELELGRWSEEEIRALLMARAVGSGCVHEFDDLVVDGDEREGAAARSGEAYIRLLWDHADGSPRVALHLWLESLVPVGPRRVRVRLFRSPDTKKLNEERSDFLWMYSALVQHDGLTPEDAARVLRWPPSRSWAALRHGEERAILEQDEGGRFRPTVVWERPLERLLRRRRMI